MKTRIHIIMFLVLSTFLIFSCKGENEEYEIASPQIIVSNLMPCIGEEVLFYYQTDISGNPKWDFGDGSTSEDALTKHIFTENGNYNVSLEFSDGKGGKTTSSISVQVMGKRLTDELLSLVDNPSQIWICAHRANTLYGKQNGIPENSIEAIQKSIEVGADLVEIDVRTTYDGYFVLMHDATINRTTNATGYVKDKTLAQLKSFKLKAANGVITNCTIPTLEEALVAGRGKIFFNMDKVGDISDLRTIRKLVTLIDSLNMFDRVLFYVSGNKETANDIKDVNSRSLIFPWASTISAINSWNSYSNTNLIQLDYQVTDVSGIISEARVKKMISYSNTLNNAGDNQMLKGNYNCIKQIKSLQLQVIQTDYPEIVKNQIEQ